MRGQNVQALSQELAKCATQLKAFQLGLDALRIDVKGVTEQLHQISALQLDHLKVSNVTLSRADVSLQRVITIPLGSELLMRINEGFLLV